MSAAKTSAGVEPLPGTTMLTVFIVRADGAVVTHSKTSEAILGTPVPSRLDELTLVGDTTGEASAMLRSTVHACLSSGSAATGQLAVGDAGAPPLMVTASPLQGDVEPSAAVIITSGAAPAVDTRSEAGRLVAEVAHELSRPISTLLSATESALLEPDLPDSTRSRLELILEKVEECRRAVRHSQSIGATNHPKTKGLDLNETVRRGVDAARAVTSHLPAALSVELSPDVPSVTGDPDDLASMVRNLTENAFHAAAESGAPHVRLATEATSGGARLTVTDNGPGIDSGVQDRLFEAFVTTKDPGAGTGLGLSVVRRIVQQHDGQVHAENRAEGGARFTVDLPAAGLPSGAPAPAIVSSGQPTCLVVDDDVSMRVLLRGYLRALGYDVSEAGDGEEALREAQATDFDLIICDVKMPLMDGAEFYRALRDSHPERASRIVFATGVLPTDDIDSFLRSLPNARLQKPFRLAALRAAIEAAVLVAISI